jgi:hypothetical protein
MHKSWEILVFIKITKHGLLWNLSPCSLQLVEQQVKAVDRLTKLSVVIFSPHEFRFYTHFYNPDDVSLSSLSLKGLIFYGTLLDLL